MRWTRWTGIVVMVPLTILEWVLVVTDGGDAVSLAGAAVVTGCLGFWVWLGITWPY